MNKRMIPGQMLGWLLAGLLCAGRVLAADPTVAPNGDGQKLSVKSGKGSDAQAVQVFLIGDSTMADKPLADNPERGWGQLLPVFFGDSILAGNIAIKNHAMNGRRSKSFIDEDRDVHFEIERLFFWLPVFRA